MKRFIAWCLLLAMVITAPLVSLAAQSDIKSLSDDDLLSLNNAIISELFARGKSALIPIGEYIVGNHIPAGEYSVELIKNEILSMAMIMIYSNESDSSLENIITLSEDVPVVGRLVLKDGKRVVISAGNITMRALNGVTIKFN